MLGLNIRRAVLAGFVAGEKDNAPRFFCVAFKHLLLYCLRAKALVILAPTGTAEAVPFHEPLFFTTLL
jgi:hypothetical protein